ncbi:hypothetical protein GCM10009547_37900 [Sporichthya brevicatena]|uniref:Universal stress protein n=1 Tax=Sporichthya brevicatena TaxID=171442 RepID=A0ABN1H6M0_9ACTN
MTVSGTKTPTSGGLLHGRVVVGLHESGHAAEALAVGFSEARRRRADLTVTVVRDGEDAGEARSLEQAVADVAAGYPDVGVATSVCVGQFAEVLVDLSGSVDLLVLGLGDRPRGLGRQDLLIASRARCPVIVVRDTPRGDL